MIKDGEIYERKSMIDIYCQICNKVESHVYNGADVHIYNNCPLRYATEMGHIKIVKYLKKVMK